MRIVFGFLLGVATIVGIGIIYIYSGLYNVAATDPHSPLIRWAFSTTMHNSVQERAGSIQPPAQFTQAEIREGAKEFKKTCVMCHGGPGVDAAHVGKGLRPDPPELNDVASHMSTPMQFWVVKHGIKMTGMPAFGLSHSDKQIWQIIAFLQQLPEMSPEEFKELAGGPAVDEHADREGSPEES